MRFQNNYPYVTKLFEIYSQTIIYKSKQQYN